MDRDGDRWRGPTHATPTRPARLRPPAAAAGADEPARAAARASEAQVRRRRRSIDGLPSILLRRSDGDGCDAYDRKSHIYIITNITKSKLDRPGVAQAGSPVTRRDRRDGLVERPGGDVSALSHYVRVTTAPATGGPL